MTAQKQEMGTTGWDERAAAYHSFLQDARAAGLEDPIDEQEPVPVLTQREVEAFYGLPQPLADADSMPVIQGERACRTRPNEFLVDRYDEDGNKRNQDDTKREIAAAQQICRLCVALTSCRVYADAVQAAMPPRSHDDRKSHFVIMAGVAYAR